LVFAASSGYLAFGTIEKLGRGEDEPPKNRNQSRNDVYMRLESTGRGQWIPYFSNKFYYATQEAPEKHKLNIAHLETEENGDDVLMVYLDGELYAWADESNKIYEGGTLTSLFRDLGAECDYKPFDGTSAVVKFFDALPHDGPVTEEEESELLRLIQNTPRSY
jgi:hypothetical protein